MSWIYQQSTGNLLDYNGQTVGIGYAGNGKGKNNPLMQNVKNMGPLPQGNYLIGEPYDSEHTGPFTLPLEPDKNNNMFGRDEFFMHGDSITEPVTASNGCIIMSRYVRNKINSSNDKILIVIE